MCLKNQGKPRASAGPTSRVRAKIATAMPVSKVAITETIPSSCVLLSKSVARSFFDFDDALTGPVHAFTGAHEYYHQSSSIHFIRDIRVPTLLMNARNDPFLPPTVLETVRGLAKDNSQLFIEFPPTGGHVGWVTGQPWAARYFMEERVIEWLSTGS